MILSRAQGNSGLRGGERRRGGEGGEGGMWSDSNNQRLKKFT